MGQSTKLSQFIILFPFVPQFHLNFQVFLGVTLSENSYVTVYAFNDGVLKCLVCYYYSLKQMSGSLMTGLIQIPLQRTVGKVPLKRLSPHDKLLCTVIDIPMIIAIFQSLDTRCL